MSRYCGEKDTRPILEAAAHWKQVAARFPLMAKFASSLES